MTSPDAPRRALADVLVRHPQTGLLHRLLLPVDDTRDALTARLVEALHLPQERDGRTVHYWLEDDGRRRRLPDGMRLRDLVDGDDFVLRLASDAFSPPGPRFEAPPPVARPEPPPPPPVVIPPPPPLPRPRHRPTFELVPEQILLLAGAAAMFVAFFAMDGDRVSNSRNAASETVIDFISRLNDLANGPGGENLRLSNFWIGIPIMAFAIVAVLLASVAQGRMSDYGYLVSGALAGVAIVFNFAGWMAIAADGGGGGSYFFRPITGFFAVSDNGVDVTNPAFPVMTAGALLVIAGAVIGWRHERARLAGAARPVPRARA